MAKKRHSKKSSEIKKSSNKKHYPKNLKHKKVARKIQHTAHKQKHKSNKTAHKYHIAHKQAKKAIIKKIKVKNIPKKIPTKRVRTGVPNFDSLIEGGFESNSTNVIVGGAGSGKSILATQFLIEGLKHGEKCLYVTFEEKKTRFYQNMLEFGWNLQEYEKKGLFTFLEYTPIKVKTMLEEGGGAIETLVLSKKITRIVIDSLTSFALLFEDELEKREAALALFNMIRKWNCTSLLSLEEEPGEKEKTASKPLEFESDSIILLYFIREGEQRKRYLEILKMRGTKHSKKLYEFTITAKGISLNSSPIKKSQL